MKKILILLLFALLVSTCFAKLPRYFRITTSKDFQVIKEPTWEPKRSDIIAKYPNATLIVKMIGKAELFDGFTWVEVYNQGHKAHEGWVRDREVTSEKYLSDEEAQRLIKPQKVHSLKKAGKNEVEYDNLAKEIGLSYAKHYEYNEWSRITKKHNVLRKGQYDTLKYSTGGFDSNAKSKFDQASYPKWATYFLRNHNMTVIFNYIKKNNKLYVALTKAKKGKHMNLDALRD